MCNFPSLVCNFADLVDASLLKSDTGGIIVDINNLLVRPLRVLFSCEEVIYTCAGDDQRIG